MNLDCHNTQDGRQAAIVLKKVKPSRSYLEAAGVDYESPAGATSKARLDQAMLLQVQHVADEGCFVSHALYFPPSIIGWVGIGSRQLLQNGALQFSVKLHRANPPVADGVVVGTSDSTTRGDAGVSHG